MKYGVRAILDFRFSHKFVCHLDIFWVQTNLFCSSFSVNCSYSTNRKHVCICCVFQKCVNLKEYAPYPRAMNLITGYPAGWKRLKWAQRSTNLWIYDKASALGPGSSFAISWCWLWIQSLSLCTSVRSRSVIITSTQSKGESYNQQCDSATFILRHCIFS